MLQIKSAVVLKKSPSLLATLSLFFSLLFKKKEEKSGLTGRPGQYGNKEKSVETLARYIAAGNCPSSYI